MIKIIHNAKGALLDQKDIQLKIKIINFHNQIKVAALQISRHKLQIHTLEETIYAMCANINYKIMKKSSTPAIVNIKYAMRVITIKSRKEKGSVQIAENTMK